MLLSLQEGNETLFTLQRGNETLLPPLVNGWVGVLNYDRHTNG